MSILNRVSYTISATAKHSQSAELVYNETGMFVAVQPNGYILLRGVLTPEVAASLEEHFDVMDDLTQPELLEE